MYWCLGMHASASTWAFNVVRQLAAAAWPDVPVHTTFVTDTLPVQDPLHGTLVVKTHGTPLGDELARLASGIVITICDPRDVVASLLRHHGAPFDIALAATEASARTCQRFIACRHALLLKYEDLFFEDPVTVDRMAGLLPVMAPAEARAGIFRSLRRSAVEAFIAELEGLATAETIFDGVTGRHETFDTISGWRTHHAGRRGVVGSWRSELSDAQVRIIEQRLRWWMQRFGYLPAVPVRRPYRVTVGRYGAAL